MTKYREILRLKSLGFSERNIAQSCGVSRNTVAKVLKKAAEINLSWPLDFDMTDSALVSVSYTHLFSLISFQFLIKSFSYNPEADYLHNDRDDPGRRIGNKKHIKTSVRRKDHINPYNSCSDSSDN